MSNSHNMIDDTNRFVLNNSTFEYLKSLTSSFDKIGEITYYRTYSRIKQDGTQEHWADTVYRVINGILTIRKDWYMKMKFPWNEQYWQKFGHDMAISMFNMNFLPSGRNLWAMGTEFVYKRGSASLYNCAAVDTKDLLKSATWTMDMALNGVGVGIGVDWTGENVRKPNKTDPETYVIEDSREGWVESVKRMLNAYIPCYDTTKQEMEKNMSYFDIEHAMVNEGMYSTFPEFDYSAIRKKGEPLKSFGGQASGPEPLIKLHKQLEKTMDSYLFKKMGRTQCVADIFNCIGACVVSGGIRRSAEILLGDADDDILINLKNTEMFPERAEWSWMSNNTIVLKETTDFEEKLPCVIDNIRTNGEPGIMNQINIREWGRIGKVDDHAREDTATLCNPCSEIPLEPFEVCNLAEIFPTRCKTEQEIMDAGKFATFYCMTVSLLPTHHPETNRVIARNRRIGVSMSGIADLKDEIGSIRLISLCRKLYKHIRAINKHYANEAGVPESIRVTTVKPSGTISLLVGCSAGMHYPIHNCYIRRIRVSDNQPIIPLLIEAGIPYEKDTYADNTQVFEIPIRSSKYTRCARDVGVYEQFALLKLLQREYSDNMVSCTINFDKEKEAHMLENVIAEFLPVIKSVSLLPHSDDETIYVQMPYEQISEEEYERRASVIRLIDWSKLTDSDGMEEKYCSTDICEIKSVRN
jgi:ribonucleoside-triphosphate reductase (thioredoxin)